MTPDGSLLLHVRDQGVDIVRLEVHQDGPEECSVGALAVGPLVRNVVTELGDQHGVLPDPGDPQLWQQGDLVDPHVASVKNPFLVHEDLLQE